MRCVSMVTRYAHRSALTLLSFILLQKWDYLSRNSNVVGAGVSFFLQVTGTQAEVFFIHFGVLRSLEFSLLRSGYRRQKHEHI
jgi:hypothetical protein